MGAPGMLHWHTTKMTLIMSGGQVFDFGLLQDVSILSLVSCMYDLDYFTSYAYLPTSLQVALWPRSSTTSVSGSTAFISERLLTLIFIVLTTEDEVSSIIHLTIAVHS